MLWVRKVANHLLAAAMMAVCLWPAMKPMMAMHPVPCGGRGPAPRACCVAGGHTTLAVVAAPALPRPLRAAPIPRTSEVVPALAAAPRGSTLSPSPPVAAARPSPLRV